MLCRTLAEIEAAAARDYAASPAPYTQEQVNRFAALLAPHLLPSTPAYCPTCGYQYEASGHRIECKAAPAA